MSSKTDEKITIIHIHIFVFVGRKYCSSKLLRATVVFPTAVLPVLSPLLKNTIVSFLSFDEAVAVINGVSVWKLVRLRKDHTTSEHMEHAEYTRRT